MSDADQMSELEIAETAALNADTQDDGITSGDDKSTLVAATKPSTGNTAPANPVPTVGRIVHYTLTETDAVGVNNTGMRVHCDSSAKAGDVYPMIIVRTFGKNSDSAVNGQVFLDGSDTLWVQSVSAGEGAGHYSWPARS